MTQKMKRTELFFKIAANTNILSHNCHFAVLLTSWLAYLQNVADT